MELKKKTFYLQYFVYYMLSCLVYTQTIPFLTELGYNATERGLLMALYQVAAIALQFLCGYLCDKKYWFKQSFVVIVIVTSVGTALLFRSTVRMFLLQMILLILSNAFMTASGTALDNMLFAYDGGRENFSFIRAFGSLGWSFASMFTAYILDGNNYGIISVYVILTGILTLAVNLFMIPLPKVGDKDASKQKSGIRLKDCIRLFKNEKYTLALLAMFFIYIPQSVMGTAFIDKLLLCGGTSTHVSYRAAIHGFVELPFYFFGVRIAKRYGYNNLLLFSSVTYALEFLCFTVFNSIFGLLASNFWQAVTGTSYMLAARYLLYEYADDDIKSTGLMLGTSLHVGIPSILMPYIGGIITDAFGPSVTLSIGVVSALIGSVFAYALIKKAKTA